MSLKSPLFKIALGCFCITLLLSAFHSISTIKTLHNARLQTLGQRPPYPFAAPPRYLQTQTPSYYLNTTGNGISLSRSLALSFTRAAGDPTTADAALPDAALSCTPDSMTNALEKLRSLLTKHDVVVTNENLEGADRCTTTHVVMALAVPVNKLETVTTAIETLLVTNGEPTASSSLSSSSELHPSDLEGATALLRHDVNTAELNDNSNAVVGPLEAAFEVARRRQRRYRALVYQEDLDAVLDGETAQPDEPEDKNKKESKKMNVTRAITFLNGLRDVETRLITVEKQLDAARERVRDLTATLEVQLLTRDVREWRIQRVKEVERLEWHLFGETLKAASIFVLFTVSVFFYYVSGVEQ